MKKTSSVLIVSGLMVSSFLAINILNGDSESKTKTILNEQSTEGKTIKSSSVELQK
jgi:hypothetical protein